MRIKSYYTATEQELNLYTFGKEWQVEDGTEYVGLYHRYNSTGEIYTRPVWDESNSKLLTEYILPVKNNIVYKTLNDVNVKGFSSPKTSIAYPTATDRKTGYFTRYFLKKITDGTIVEVNQAQYTDWQSNTIDKNAYTGISLKWYVSGQLEDTINGSVTILGVESKNFKELATANLVMTGIFDEFSSLTEYYLSSDITMPKDING